MEQGQDFGAQFHWPLVNRLSLVDLFDFFSRTSATLFQSIKWGEVKANSKLSKAFTIRNTAGTVIEKCCWLAISLIQVSNGTMGK